MAIVQASGLTKFIGERQLLQDVSFRLERGGRLALSGRNGSGKTTLLRILAGEASADSGRVSLAKNARVVLHDQRPPRDLALTLGDYVVGGLGWVLEIERKMASLEERMASEADEATLAAYADAQARFEVAGGYRWRDEARETVRGLGFGRADLDRDLSTFSGGELTRASLARALAAKPDLLLLDEPTNHLDIASLEWLEEMLIGMDAAVILVAHDRWFLESVGNSVLELGEGRPKFFSGPWHEWRIEKARRELFLERDAKRREADIARLERFVERFRAKNTLATRAKSKQKQINRIKRDAPQRDPSAVEVACLLVRGGAALGQGGAGDGGRDHRRRLEAAVRGRRDVGGGGRARLPDRPQRLGQVHPDLGARRRARAGLRAREGRPQRRARAPAPARRGAGRSRA